MTMPHIACISGLVLACWSGLSLAGWANPQLLVSPGTVEKNAKKPDWVVVDCRSLRNYNKGHIPGAISLGGKCAWMLRDKTERAFRDISKYETLLGKAGISNDSSIVFYHGDLNTLLDSAVAFWILEYLGHDKVYILEGGVDAWRKTGKQLRIKTNRKKPGVFKAKLVASRYATSEEMLRVGEGKEKGLQLIDSRTKSEHDGSEVHALRGGSIRNTTINVSHDLTLAAKKKRKTGKTGASRYLDADTVGKLFEGLDKSKRTVAYSNTGTRSAMTYLQLRLLGFENPANYDESWRVYGSNIDFPVDNEQWFDYWNTQRRIDDLERRMKKLEKRVK